MVQITIIQDILSEINVRKGESECQYYIDKLDFLDEKQRDPLIDECKTLLCHGELRTKSGSVSPAPVPLITSLCYSEIIIRMLIPPSTCCCCFFPEATRLPLL